MTGEGVLLLLEPLVGLLELEDLLALFLDLAKGRLGGLTLLFGWAEKKLNYYKG